MPCPCRGFRLRLGWRGPGHRFRAKLWVWPTPDPWDPPFGFRDPPPAPLAPLATGLRGAGPPVPTITEGSAKPQQKKNLIKLKTPPLVCSSKRQHPSRSRSVLSLIFINEATCPGGGGGCPALLPLAHPRPTSKATLQRVALGPWATEPHRHSPKGGCEEALGTPSETSPRSSRAAAASTKSSPKPACCKPRHPCAPPPSAEGGDRPR